MDILYKFGEEIPRNVVEEFRLERNYAHKEEKESGEFYFEVQWPEKYSVGSDMDWEQSILFDNKEAAIGSQIELSSKLQAIFPSGDFTNAVTFSSVRSTKPIITYYANKDVPEAVIISELSIYNAPAAIGKLAKCGLNHLIDKYYEQKTEVVKTWVKKDL